MNFSESILDLTRLRESVNKQMFPHKIVRLDEIEFAGNNLFKCNNTEMVATKDVIEKIDKMIHVTEKQTGIVKNMSGNDGLNNFKNYLSVAANASRSQRVVLFANPSHNTLDDMVTLTNEYISSDMFFDFLDIFINRSNYEIVKCEYNSNELHKGMTFYLNPATPSVEQICKNEEFITDGIFIHWTVDAVEMGNYFTRIICSNGAIRIARRNGSKVYALSPDNVRGLINCCKEMKRGFGNYKLKVLQAIRTTASLSEMRYAFCLLTTSGLQSNDANWIIPYEMLRSSLSGRFAHIPAKQIKTSYSLWDIYNRLTDFSSNNELWKTTDPRRGRIALRAGALLDKKPDIINYMEI
jgi:hypothetical protein